MLKDKQTYGWVALDTPFEPPVCFWQEWSYYTKRVILDLFCFPFFVCAVLGIGLWKKIRKQPSQKRMFFGSHPIVILMHNKHVLEEEYACVLFAFEDYSKGKMHDGLTLRDIMPSFLIGKSPYMLGSYWAMIWVLVRFDMVHLYFDGGLLERTVWWRLEAWCYQLCGIKIVMYPYGTDVMSVSHNTNRIQRFGHMRFSKRYFLLDKKREERNFWWSKYANLIVGYAPYIDFLPRLDVLTWHGHIVQDVLMLPFPSLLPKIKIVHFASHGVRKSSFFIAHELERLAAHYPHVEIECLSGLPRDIAIQKLEEAHIFIDSLNDGYLQFSSLEAMLKGRVTLSLIDAELQTFFTQIAPLEYQSFFRDLPLMGITHETLYEKLEALVLHPECLESIAKKSGEFAHEMVTNNIEGYRAIIAMLMEPQ
ncbi:hypothetical protein [Sulfurospirillum halorespirans]|uniref:Glycosyltransferase n=1 Tax=Sulfurospirillum halorespirans DSM 13726 TaxID=1193502 RepID=A0A1D7TNV2_9BACT|nr:hypothetical protein [Sulfurospirillum halorespirans]AOO66676.1 hypothetical protein SHALO_2924 [Sulfurospirillum halorespirans DSM 13726]